MAIIRISDSYRLKSDSHCWAAQRFVGIRKDSSEEWESFAYYVDLGKAARAMCEHRLRASEAANVVELRREWERINAEMQAIMEQFSDLTETGGSAS